ncbi:MAG: hypothetical protein L0220_16985 [Acidobacteria bacterium]|nr:hypothetical protein [Acidobacteriota bacterium]
MKLSEWARQQGISYRTSLRWFHDGTLPVEAEQMETGTIIVKLQSISDNRAAKHKAEKAIKATQEA